MTNTDRLTPQHELLELKNKASEIHFNLAIGGKYGNHSKYMRIRLNRLNSRIEKLESSIGGVVELFPVKEIPNNIDDVDNSNILLKFFRWLVRK
jgi:hypothetical protein